MASRARRRTGDVPVNCTKKELVDEHENAHAIGFSSSIENTIAICIAAEQDDG